MFPRVWSAGARTASPRLTVFGARPSTGQLRAAVSRFTTPRTPGAASAMSSAT